MAKHCRFISVVQEATTNGCLLGLIWNDRRCHGSAGFGFLFYFFTAVGGAEGYVFGCPCFKNSAQGNIGPLNQHSVSLTRTVAPNLFEVATPLYNSQVTCDMPHAMFP